MSQVLLRWDGGHRELLARVIDAEGTWLCHREVHSKLGSSMSRQTWHKHIKQGEHTPFVSLMLCCHAAAVSLRHAHCGLQLARAAGQPHIWSWVS